MPNTSTLPVHAARQVLAASPRRKFRKFTVHADGGMWRAGAHCEYWLRHMHRWPTGNAEQKQVKRVLSGDAKHSKPTPSLPGRHARRINYEPWAF